MTPSQPPLPLGGLRVLLPRRDDPALAAAVADAGAEVATVPLTRVVAAPEDERRRIAERLRDGFDWIAVTSATTVRLLPGAGLAATSARIAAVGLATARALAAAGLTVALQPSSGSGGAALLAAWPDGTGRVALPGARAAAPALAEGLRARGWDVVALPLYDVVGLDSAPAATRAAWREGGVDVFVVTAGSTARAARDLLGPGGPPVIALGEPSARAARAAGLDVHGVCGGADPAALVAALRSFVQGDPR